MTILRLLLLPFSVLYGIVVIIRNWLYDAKIFNSYRIPVKSILVGNLSAGGTGKTPHTAYLGDILCENHAIAILSRGYGRKSKGFLWVDEAEDVCNSGDEPLFYAKRFNGKVKVAVCESRAEGVQRILKEQKKTKLILLDDAFQHRAVTAGFSIVLSDYSSPYYSDFLLPAGRLREPKGGLERADCLIVTKCPSTMREEQKTKMVSRLKFHNSNVFFSSIEYGELHRFGKNVESFKKVLLVTGIANPNPLIDYYGQKGEIEHLNFPDHHQFTEKDIVKIHSKFDTFANETSIIVTTEKDFVRLDQVLTADQKKHYPWYYQSITIKLDDETRFNQLIKKYVDTV